ncbi:L-arabinose isomerase [Haloglycomyces albus]|uniref:L-arabinose isomerase n=1 Tax=Haloglycomyces albus TaxID=526067 RepID=UPI00046CACEF|nr:L-arabinose isomerase [Haloglycomyces albus]
MTISFPLNAPNEPEIWFLTGSQDLYGDETLRIVAEQSAQIAGHINHTNPINVVSKPTVTSSDAIRRIILEANASDQCIGLITWMHTFSPAKMWISGLTKLQKPLLHFHTQFNLDLPWDRIDMDFMNLNQAAHGDREFAHIATRLNIPRKTVVGHWEQEYVTDQIETWSRAAAGFAAAQNLKIARFGDNMRNVAVTDGDKVSAEIDLGPSINGYGVNEIAARVEAIPNSATDDLIEIYLNNYSVSPELRPQGNRHQSLRDAAKIEVALREFLRDVGAHGFTDTFEDLGTLPQLPGIAVQRLMNEGFGFGAEGDWKTAILVRIAKVMAAGLDGGTSFMEDYTYNLGVEHPQILGAHMLEVCPSLASDVPTCEIHPLAMGAKADPVRLVFTAPTGPAFNIGLTDLGDRFRLVGNEVDVVPPEAELPNLPVARAVWEPKPNLATSAAAWMHAGAPHHTLLSQAIGREVWEDFANMAGIEMAVIDERTDLREFKKELAWNKSVY